ncbi:zinc finger BED domain-containing protein RICESLEEPER 2, partial [Tanacetum coccineum]
MKSEIIGYGFKHLIENGCIPVEVNKESEKTPIQFLTDEELSDKLVNKVEKDITTTTRRRGNAFLNAFKDKVGNKLIGGDDELTKYLKEPHLELEDDQDFDILNCWKLNSPRFPIISCQSKYPPLLSNPPLSGRVLDPYRNCLAPNIVEALVCTQDWIRTSSKNMTMDTLEDLLKDEELAKVLMSAHAIVLDDSCLSERDLSCSLMGKIKDINAVSNLYFILANEGFENLKLSYIGGQWFLIEFDSIASKEKISKNSGATSWFSMSKGRLFIIENEESSFDDESECQEEVQKSGNYVNDFEPNNENYIDHVSESSCMHMNDLVYDKVPNVSDKS